MRQFLIDSGYEIPDRVGVLCHHPDPRHTFLTLTPDLVFPDLRLAVEVDPCGDHVTRGSSHTGDEATDRIRNELLAAVGWTVIRLRLGATEGQHIGNRDVVAESATFTKAAQTALLTAIDDFQHGRPATVRLVKKTKRTTPAKRRSHVVNISLDPYSDDTYWFTWFPSLDSPEKVSLRLAANGRYLYQPSGRTPLFVAEVALHDIDRSEWKDRLTAYLADKTPSDLVGTTKWPWGDTLIMAPDPDDETAQGIVLVSDHEKQNIDRLGFWFTVTGDHIAEWTPDSLLRADGTPLAVIHPEAVSGPGYRFAEVTLDRGYRGPYQRITITRVPASGLSE